MTALFVVALVLGLALLTIGLVMRAGARVVHVETSDVASD